MFKANVNRMDVSITSFMFSNDIILSTCMTFIPNPKLPFERPRYAI